MNKSISRIATGVAAAALCVGAAAGTAAATTSGGPAIHIMTNVAPANWNGNCAAISFTNTAFTGWCDGTGPQTYGTYVDCSDGFRYDSTYVHWYGDRRGVTSFCPAGTARVGEGYLLF